MRAGVGQRSRRRAAILLLVSLAGIAAATLGPSYRPLAVPAVRWCVTCGPLWLTDVISNLVLFVPLGIALTLRGVGKGRVMLLAALLSLGIEILQSTGWPTGRTAALADWLMNSAGAALGVMLVHWRHTLLTPSRRSARALLLGWTVMMVATLEGTRWALQPAVRSVGTSAPVSLSRLPFTPRYGWYSARSSDVHVNSVPVAHTGTGPTIVAMERTDAVHAAVVVRGRDAREHLVPIVYVHAPNDAIAHFLLGQRGQRANIRGALNAARVGLTSPELSLDHVFTSDDTLTTVGLSATVTTTTLELAARGTDGVERTAHLTLSPLMGWALIQSVVRADSPARHLMTSLWVLAWLGPWTYWVVWSLRARRSRDTSASTHHSR